MSELDDIAAIVHPMPEPGDVPDEHYDDACHATEEAREALIDRLNTGWNVADVDPLIGAIREAAHQRDQADAEVRRLIAYGREFTRPRPYKLTDLAQAAVLSISGVRTAYDHADVADVQERTGLKPRDWRATSPEDPPEIGDDR